MCVPLIGELTAPDKSKQKDRIRKDRLAVPLIINMTFFSSLKDQRCMDPSLPSI